MRILKLKTILLIATVIVGSCLTSCNNKANPTLNEEAVSLDTLMDGTIVVLSFQVNGEDFSVPFVKVGDTYQLLEDYLLTRAGESEASEKDYDITMVHDKAKSLLTFYVKEKATGSLVLNAVYDIKNNTLEATAGDKTYKVTNLKLDVSGDSGTLAAALVKGSKVVISVKYYGNTTVFTFINDGNFACSISGKDAEDFQGSSLKLDGSTLKFHAVNWNDPDSELEIHFFPDNNTWKFWTVHHDAYDSHTISVNGTDITTKLKKED